MGVGSGLYMHVSPKGCKIGGKLVLIINRKSEVVYELSIGTKIGDLE